MRVADNYRSRILEIMVNYCNFHYYVNTIKNHVSFLVLLQLFAVPVYMASDL